MNDAACDAPDDLDAFLAWESLRPERFERLGGRIRPRRCCGPARARIALNLYLGLRARLRTKSRRDVHRDRLKIVARRAGAVLYPDVFVRCGPLLAAETSAEDPAVVFEIQGPGVGHGERVAAYQSIASLRCIVRVAEESARLDVLRRNGIGWSAFALAGPAAVLELPEIRVKISLVEIYEAVELDLELS